MKIIKTASALTKYISSVKSSSKTIGFVPTMGALHDGHFSLVQQSVKQNDVTVVSIFVNPLQFGANEDLDAYPRTFKEDSEGLRNRNVDVLFFPEYHTFYTQSHQTYVTNNAVQHLYCGAYRNGHFDGVLTVVSKFFNVVQPNRAYFGRKDYQQAYLIKKMVVDLSYPIKIVLGKTVREKSGLAMSSRNKYLSDAQQTNAVSISRGLKKILAMHKLQNSTVAKIKKSIEKDLLVSGADSVQYIEVASRETLLPLSGKVVDTAVVLVAVFYGTTRLIDNIEI